MGPKWGPDPPRSHYVPAEPAWAPGHLCPNLEVTPSHRSPKGLWEKSPPAMGVPSGQGAPHPFRVASAGHYLIPHGAARPLANRLRCKYASCSPSSGRRTPSRPGGNRSHTSAATSAVLGGLGVGRPSSTMVSSCLGPGAQNPPHQQRQRKGSRERGGTLAELQEICRKQAHPEEVAGGRAGLATQKRGPPPPTPSTAGAGAGRAEPRGLRCPCRGTGSCWGGAQDEPGGLSAVVVGVLGPVSQQSTWGTGSPGPAARHHLQRSHACCSLPSPAAPGRVWAPGQVWAPGDGGPAQLDPHCPVLCLCVSFLSSMEGTPCSTPTICHTPCVCSGGCHTVPQTAA